MRSKINKDEYFKEVAKKKPKYQEYLTNLHKLDIENLQEPLWVRQALTTVKEKQIKDDYVKNMDLSKYLSPDEKTWPDKVRVFTCNQTFWVSRIKGFEFQIDEGTVWGEFSSSSILNGYNYLPDIPWDGMQKLLNNSTYMETVNSRDGYLKLYNDKLNTLIPDNIIDLTGSNPHNNTVLNQYGVKIG